MRGRKSSKEGTTGAAKLSVLSLGKKRICPRCRTKFYDFNKGEAECPRCDDIVIFGQEKSGTNGGRKRPACVVIEDTIIEEEANTPEDLDNGFEVNEFSDDNEDLEEFEADEEDDEEADEYDDYPLEDEEEEAAEEER